MRGAVPTVSCDSRIRLLRTGASAPGYQKGLRVSFKAKFAPDPSSSILINSRRRKPGKAAPVRNSAFTLLELIVAMAMVAILVTSLYASLRIGFKAKASAEAAVEPSRTAELAMEFLRGDLQNTIGPAGILAGSFEGTNGTDDRGRDDDDLIFYSTADGPNHTVGNGEIKKIELTVTQQPGSTDHVLVRRVIRNLLSQTTVTPDEEVLCRGVGAFNLRYLDGSQWQDSWDSTQETDTLPVAVEVTLQLDRPIGAPDARPLRFVRVFPIACSTILPGSTGGTN